MFKIDRFKKAALIFGLDRAIIYTAAARIVQALGGVVTILFVARYLSEVEQGFYYTFGSIVAIQIFFELGLNGIITQYVAHEASHLQWNNDLLDGESKYRSRLASLLHFSVKWYLWFAFLLFLTLITVGFFFFTRYGPGSGLVYWQAPWLLLAVATGISLLVSPLMAFIEGLGRVREIARIRLLQQVVVLGIVWAGLLFGGKLFASGIGNLAGTILLVGIILFGKYRRVLLNIWRETIIEKVHYRREIFPYQWKIALSWISGYFIFQLFNPVIFATEGAVVAGQMGMTLAVLNGILSLSLAWITTKVPLFSGLIARKEYAKLDGIFNSTLKQSAFINFAALAFLGMIIFLLKHNDLEIGGRNIGNRFLDYFPLACMMIPIFLNQFVAAWATYLRCHKQEPFLINSLVGGILCSLSTVLLGRYFGVTGVTVGYCMISLSMFPWSYKIYREKKAEWHAAAPSRISKNTIRGVS